MILLLSATMTISAQKMTIKTMSGQMVEITCEDGIVPAEIQVEGDKVTFKMNKAEDIRAIETETSTDAKVSDDAISAQADAVKIDSLKTKFSNSDSQPSLAQTLADSLMEEIAPGYAKFTEEHKNDNPEESVKNFTKNIVGEEAVENVSFFASLFSGLRFTKDTTFVAKYEQRKPKPNWRKFDVIEIEGSFGQNIEGVSDAMAKEINYDDYGDDTSNEKKIGGGIAYSRTYISGYTSPDGVWKPNKIGFGISWGGLLSYSYEKDMGSYVNFMGKAGVQIGHDITIGVDGLLGCGVTPYNTFYSNGMNYSMLNKSAFCFKYGVQLWGSINFSKATYTKAYARYICSVKPNSAITSLPTGWETIVEDFDPTSWTVGLAVGYHFGDPINISTDKRLQATISTGYQFAGHQKGLLISTEFERITKVSPSTTLNTGLMIEQLFDQKNTKERYISVLFSGGFKVNQPERCWFWGAKAMAGVGDYAVKFDGKVDDYIHENSFKKLCIKTALELSGGLKLGKCSEIFTALRLGYHFGKRTEIDGYESAEYVNLSGFTGATRLGCKFTF